MVKCLHKGGEILIFPTLLLDWGVKDPVPAPWAVKTPTLPVPSPTRPMSHWPQTKGKTNKQTTSNKQTEEGKTLLSSPIRPMSHRASNLNNNQANRKRHKTEEEEN